MQEQLCPRPGKGFKCRSCSSEVDSVGECYIMHPPEALFVNLQNYEQMGDHYVKTRDHVITDEELVLDEAVIVGKTSIFM